jgi:hypothetical protein
MIDKTAAAPREGWFTSSYTNGSQTCVEVNFDSGTVLVRDTKHRRPMILVTPASWSAFLNILTV